jgi:Type IX secretion system membrane protein PorP/SprF
MFKNALFFVCVFACIGDSTAQVTNAHSLFQYSMTPFQATALPYNYLDKFDRTAGGANTERGDREDTKLSSGWYLNASTRSEIHQQTGVTTSGICAVDKMSDPNQLGLIVGGGVMYDDLQAVQITSPFVHVSAGKALDDHWRILGGVSYRYSSQHVNLSRITYKDLDDPKIEIAAKSAQTSFNVVGVSAAFVHIEKMYLGVGVNRILGGKGEFASFNNKTFTEANLLFQYAFKTRPNANPYSNWSSRSVHGSMRAENPNRGFFTNVNVSVAMRYVMSAEMNYPFHAQINCRASIAPMLWTGLGWNTANRLQLQFGLLKIPVFKADASSNEYQLWVAYDLPTQNTPKHGVEFNLGYYF